MRDPLTRIIDAAKAVVAKFSEDNTITYEQNLAIVELSLAVNDMENAATIINAEAEKMLRMLDNEPGANPFSAIFGR